jgi:circadian clock protein KaiC
MLNGGFPAGSVTAVVGPSGVGKTTLGLQFMQGVRADQPGLWFSFHETPERIKIRARRFSFNLDKLIDDELLSLLWQPQVENIQDALAYRLLDAVAERGVKRLLIDGLEGFWESVVDLQRLGRFFTALMNELRSRGVTVVFTLESNEVLGRDLKKPLPFGSALVENWIALRFVEDSVRLRRYLSLVKVRDSHFDATVREFRISDRGIVLSPAREAPSIPDGNASVDPPSSRGGRG